VYSRSPSPVADNAFTDDTHASSAGLYQKYSRELIYLKQEFQNLFEMVLNGDNQVLDDEDQVKTFVSVLLELNNFDFNDVRLNELINLFNSTIELTDQSLSLMLVLLKTFAELTEQLRQSDDLISIEFHNQSINNITNFDDMNNCYLGIDHTLGKIKRKSFSKISPHSMSGSNLFSDSDTEKPKSTTLAPAKTPQKPNWLYPIVTGAVAGAMIAAIVILSVVTAGAVPATLTLGVAVGIAVGMCFGSTILGAVIGAIAKKISLAFNSKQVDSSADASGTATHSWLANQFSRHKQTRQYQPDPRAIARFNLTHEQILAGDSNNGVDNISDNNGHIDNNNDHPRSPTVNRFN
jgi:hypothetical protein